MRAAISAIVTLLVLVGVLQCRQASALDCKSPQPGAAEPATTLVLAEGDSITSGDGSTDGRGSYVSRAALSATPGVAVLNHGRSHAVMGSRNDGPDANSLYGRMRDDDRLVAAKASGTRYVLTVLIGRNDLVDYGSAPAYLEDLVRYADTMKRAGWDEVYVGTLLPSAWVAFGPLRQDFNRDLMAICRGEPGAIDKVIEFATIPGMSADGDALDRRLFVDGTHPSNLGYALMARAYDAAFGTGSR